MTQHPDNRHSDIPRSSCFFIFFCCLSGTCSLFLLALRVLSFFFHTFCTCQVGHLFSSILTSHISNFSSKFWSCRWQTLHPPRAVVCRPRQTKGCYYPEGDSNAESFFLNILGRFCFFLTCFLSISKFFFRYFPY